MQTLPVTTKLRNAWEDAIEDNFICEKERALIAQLITIADDGVRHARIVLGSGPETRRARESREDYERLHGPISLDEHRKQKQRRRDCNPDSAA